MLRPPPFPISLDELTVEELSDGLGVPVASFTAERIGADRGMLGEIFLLTPTYAEPGTGPGRVVAKFAALRDGSLASARRSRSNERELRCYDELLVETPVRTPDYYSGCYDPETAHFLLFQEAIDADTTVDQVAGIGPDRARLVVIEAARLHARWWGDPRLATTDWLPRLDGTERMTNLTTLARTGWPLLCDLLGEALAPAERGLGQQFPDRLEAALRHVASLPSTLVHSDLRADNLLFSPDGSAVTIVDWQGVGLGPPGFDLSYFLSQSLTVDDRRTHEGELLELYRTTLASAGVALSPDEVRAGYGESMHYGLAVACALPVISDPGEPRVRDLASTVARRSIEALRDHNQLWKA